MRVLRINESVLALALEYLGLEDLVAFDSAVTNREGRGHYLTALSRVDVTRMLEGTRENNWGENARWRAAFKWVATRGLRLPVVFKFPGAATDETLALLQRCESTGRFVREVEVSECERVTSAGLAHLKLLTGLQRLKLSGDGITDA